MLGYWNPLGRALTTREKLLGGGAFALVAGSLALRAVTKRSSSGAIERVIRRVSAHEGGFDATNPNTDNAGLSFGILQWPQRTGGLGQLLAAMRQADAGAFDAVFGGADAARALLAATAARSLEPVAGALLWREPWISRFKAAGKMKAFQDVQLRLAKDAEWMQGALSAARTLDTPSERALTLYFDTAVQQGPGAARAIAEGIRARLPSPRPLEKQILAMYAQAAADRFRRQSAPAELKTGSLEWKQVGGEWHRFAGRIDLYADILRRRTGIVNDRSISDEAIT